MSVAPQLSVRRGRAAVEFYERAFGAIEVRAKAAGAAEVYPVADEHGWRLGRIIDPFGHHWEIGTPLGPWPPASGRPKHPAP